MSDDPAIPAATLILVRDRTEGPPQLLMVERASGMAFAGGALVFPGGRIDQADRELGARFAAADAAARVAAIRETVEETAIPVGLAPAPTQAHALDMQQSLAAERSFSDLLAEDATSLELDALTPFARWVPRFHAVRRFDTLFFIAKAEENIGDPHPLPGECAGAQWVTAAEVLEREAAGEARLIFPTRRNLERLAQHSSFDQIRADALAHPVEAVTPWVETVDGEQFITIPDHLGYPVTCEKLDGLWRG